MNNIFYYDIKKSFDERLTEATDMIKKYPDKIPVIVEQISKNKRPNLDRNKFLCPQDINIGQFILILRNRLGLKSAESIFIFISGKSLANNTSILDAYKNYGDTDKFLKIKYNLESSFGN
jgi:GABA(A) receptor-associated protein